MSYLQLCLMFDILLQVLQSVIQNFLNDFFLPIGPASDRQNSVSPAHPLVHQIILSLHTKQSIKHVRTNSPTVLHGQVQRTDNCYQAYNVNSVSERLDLATIWWINYPWRSSYRQYKFLSTRSFSTPDPLIARSLIFSPSDLRKREELWGRECYQINLGKSGGRLSIYTSPSE